MAKQRYREAKAKAMLPVVAWRIRCSRVNHCSERHDLSPASASEAFPFTTLSTRSSSQSISNSAKERLFGVAVALADPAGEIGVWSSRRWSSSARAAAAERETREQMVVPANVTGSSGALTSRSDDYLGGNAWRSWCHSSSPLDAHPGWRHRAAGGGVRRSCARDALRHRMLSRSRILASPRSTSPEREVRL